MASSETVLALASEQIEGALNACKLEDLKGLSELKRAIALATGMKALRAALTPEVVKDLFIPLRGTSLGFRTDRDDQTRADAKPAYSIEVVTDCVIEAMIRGFSVVGNEFNIIAGRAYFTKEGLERRVAEWEGLKHFESSASMPVLNEKLDGAAVAYRGSWELHGVKMELNCDKYPVEVFDSAGAPLLDSKGEKVTRFVDERIPIRVNAGMGLDAILGKARRKYLALVIRKLTGSRFGITDGDLSDLPSVETTGQDTTQKEGVAAKVDKLVEQRRKERQAGKEGQKQGSEPPPPIDGEEPGVNPAG